MTETRALNPQLLRPDQVADLIIGPTLAESAAAAVSTVVNIAAPSLRVPLLSELPTAKVIPEGEEYPISPTRFAETRCVPVKIGVADVVTRELADDSSPAAAEVFAKSLAAALAVKLDRCFIGADTVDGMPGLEQIAATEVTVGAEWTGADIVTAQSVAESHGTRAGVLLLHPEDKTAIRRANVTTVAVRQPIEADDHAVDTLLGSRVVTSPHVPKGTLYAIPTDRATLVVRDTAEVQRDESVFFLADKVAIKASVRIGWVFTQPAAIARVKLKA